MNERIKEIRKYFHLNQTEFGERIGVKQTTVAGYETGGKNPLDTVLFSICREFNVSLDWLLTGEGKMFEDLPATLVDEMAETYHLDDMDKKIISAFLELSAQEREIIKKYLSSIFAEKKDLP